MENTLLKIFLFFPCLALNSVAAQNLIPNPGFEEIFTVLEYQWVQPQGPYYHYEEAEPHEDPPPLSGRYINGLCMYNGQPNEYLHVKLLEPLKAGVQYKIELNARLLRAKSARAELQDLIGVHFGYEKLDTHIPGDLYLKPQVNLKLPDGDRFEWFLMTDTFTAAGGEQYLSLGYFPDTRATEAKQKAKDAFFEEIEEKYQSTKSDRIGEDMKWMYLPPDEQKAYLKEQKKKNKKNKGNEGKSGSSQKKYTPPPPNRSDYKNEHDRYDPTRTHEFDSFFAVRYYFDDLCLRPLLPGADTVCKPANLPEEISEGKTINLRNVFFETDSDELREESEIQLRALMNLLISNPAMTIEIKGYTDNVGADAYNLDLSKRRAAAVKFWLENKGIDSERINTQGYGSAFPIESNTTEGGRAHNRRVTFTVISM